MKKIYQKICLALLCGLSAEHSSALYFSSYIYEMMSEEDHIARPVMNDTTTVNMYQISSYKIERPSEHEENIIVETNRELIYTPIKLKIDPDKQDYFKIIYIGPKDDKERYYRVSFLETALNAYEQVSKPKSSLFSPSISLSTILIVRPRIQHLQYEVDEKKGVIRNTGNTFFRVIIHQGCNGKDEDAVQFYMLPGEEYQNNNIKEQNRKFIIANKKYIPVGNMCKSSE